MKTKLLFYVLFCVTLFTFSQTTYVPDNNFEQTLIDQGYDSGPLDDYVLTATINAIINLNVSNKNIVDLTGIEDFLNLELLYCNDNQLTSLDLSQNTALIGLWCFNNQITTLDVQQNTALTLLNITNNQLISLNVKNGNNTNFTYFGAYTNPSLLCIDVDNAAYSTTNWTNIDATASFSEDCSISYTYIPDNNFEQALIDLGYDTVLDDYVPTANINTVTFLYLQNKNISDLTGIEDFVALTNLSCESNQLTSLDVSANTVLTNLSCGNNQLSSLDISNNIALTNLNCFNNQITSLDLTQNIALTFLNTANNQLTSLDLSQNTALTQLGCNNNSLTSLNVKNGNNTNFTTFIAYGNPNLTCIEVDNVAYSTTNWTNIDATASFSTDCSVCVVTIPDANFKAYLVGEATINTNGDSEIQCSEASVFSGTINVSNLSISDLTGIEAFTDLTYLYCNNNSLTSLDVSQNTALIRLFCYNNSLTSLDVSQNTALVTLHCYNNSLTTLNVANGNNSNISNASFNATNNPNLTCIKVDDVAYSTTNWTNIDAQTSFSTDCSACVVTVADVNFKAYLVGEATINTNGDSEIQCSEASAFSGTINASNLSISDLTGIEAFTSLQVLNCYSNLLTSLDLTQNMALTFLDCWNNSLTTLDISANTVLTSLYCNNNSLTTLNVANGNNSNISNANFNATNNPNLTCIEVDNVAYSTTNWTNIDATASFSTDCNACVVTIPDANFKAYLVGEATINTNGDSEIQCSEASAFTGTINVNYLSISDLTGIEAFTALTVLSCYYNSLTSLDVSQNTALTVLSCYNNSLASLDVSQNTALIRLWCNNNSLTSLDVSQNTVLEWLFCGNNALASLDIGQNTALNRLSCDNNSLTSLNVANGNNTSFTTFNATNNPNLTCIEVDNVAYSTTNWINIDAQTSFSTDCSAACVVTIPDANFKSYLVGEAAINTNGDSEIQCNEASTFAGTINVSNLSILDLTGIEAFTALTNLYCYNNSLTSLDVSQNIALERLYCGDNQLTILDVSNNILLKRLECYSNFQLASLDLTTNVALTSLYCYNTNIASLDLTTNILLQTLRTFSTELTSLDLSNNIDLTYLSCANNQITSLDLSVQTGLTFISCINNALTSLNIKNGNNTNITTFDATNNSGLTCIEVDDVTYADANFTNIDAQTSFSTNCVYPIQLSAKVYLQGAATNPNAGEGTWMRDDLRVNGLIPTTSPYTDALTLNASVFNPTGSNAIVDWVFVELRDQANSATVLASQSALLQRDGDVVGLDGVSPLSFNLASGNYFVAITHRNHIGVISAATFSLSPTTTIVDFSASSTAAQGGTNALTNLGNGIYAIYTGDFDGNSQIQNTDANAVIAMLGGSGYSDADMDNNSQIQNTDVNTFINPNIGKGQQFAKIAGGGSKAYSANAAHNITFSFANAQNTNDGTNDFYEVDVLIESDQDFKLGSGQLYFNYNTAAFGNNISASGTIEYTQPTNYILGAVNTLPIYGQFIQNDNTTSRVSLSWQQALSSGAITSNNVTATPTLLFHIKIQYIDVAQSPTVCFEQDPLFLDQTFTACGPTTFATVDCTNFPGAQLLNDNFNCIGATLSVAKLNLDLNIKLYPNPAKSEFRIEGLLENSQLEIYNLNGVLVLKQQNYKGSPINVSSLSASVYFVKISNGNATRVKRLIVE